MTTTQTTEDNTWLLELFAQAGTEPEPVKTAETVSYVTNKKACPRCGGHGQLPSFRHVSGGVCFACNGSGNAKK